MRIVLLTFDTALTQTQVDNMRTEAQRQMGGNYIVIALPRGVSMTMVDEPGEYTTRCAAGIKAFVDVMQVDGLGFPVETNEIVRKAPRYVQFDEKGYGTTYPRPFVRDSLDKTMTEMTSRIAQAVKDKLQNGNT